MKKTQKYQRQAISKQAYQVAKNGAATVGIDTKASEIQAENGVSESTQSEEEIMGESGQGNKSGAMEKNLSQMVNVLNARLHSLENVVSLRLRLCEEDLLPNSIKSTKTHASKLGDESDEVIPRSLKDTKTSSSYHRDNLVSSDTVFIDPYHLVLKTKQTTEAAKQLEQNLEESFGNINLREMKSKKSKTLNQSEKSKKSEQLKNEAKRINRLKIEKTLQLNMETFLTRSVMDTENGRTFKPPVRINEEADWPISIKWSSRDPRCQRPENSEGEFDPELLLRYGLERINLPSGKKLFSWLIRQSIIQRYFVTLFWLIKVKFFENEEYSTETEAYLLRLMSIEYRQIVEMLALRAHAEHEKDFAFKFLPFILSNTVFFTFYYIFPGSRHIYTKGFKKTIYMQVIQLMHGIQLCPSTVKVSWAKLFPEDNHEDGDEGEDGGESFPVQIALKVPKFGKEYLDNIQTELTNKSSHSVTDDTTTTVASEGNTNANSKLSLSYQLPPIVTTGRTGPDKKTKVAQLASDQLQDDHPKIVNSRIHHVHPNQAAVGAAVNNSVGIAMNNTISGPSAPSSHLHRHTALGGGGLTINSKLDVKNLRRSVSVVAMPGDESMSFMKQTNAAANGANSFGSNNRHSLTSLDLGETIVEDSPRVLHVQGPNDSFFLGASTQGYIKAQNHMTLENFFEKPGTQDPLLRTFLKPQLQRPKNKYLIKRQNNIEPMNAQGMSPQMQLYLSTMESSSGPGVGKSNQTFRRTVPVSWCAAGGSDTHRKRVVSTDLHAEISSKLRASEYEFRRQSSKFHRMRTESLQEIDVAIDKVLASGPTNISKFSLDIRRQRNAKDGTVPPEVTVMGGIGEGAMTLAEAQQLALFDDDDLERFIREL